MAILRICKMPVVGYFEFLKIRHFIGAKFTDDVLRVASCTVPIFMVEPLLRYGDFLFFKMAVLRHLVSLKI